MLDPGWFDVEWPMCKIHWSYSAIDRCLHERWIREAWTIDCNDPSIAPNLNNHYKCIIHLFKQNPPTKDFMSPPVLNSRDMKSFPPPCMPLFEDVSDCPFLPCPPCPGVSPRRPPLPNPPILSVFLRLRKDASFRSLGLPNVNRPLVDETSRSPVCQRPPLDGAGDLSPLWIRGLGLISPAFTSCLDVTGSKFELSLSVPLPLVLAGLLLIACTWHFT